MAAAHVVVSLFISDPSPLENMKIKTITSLLAAAGLLLAASPAMAVNITISDNLAGSGFDGGPFGVGLEDNETEPGAAPGQEWDMEAFVVDGSTLYIVGGYDMIDGELNYLPGDLFIKVGGASSPSGAPYIDGSLVTSNTAGYTWAVDLSPIALGAGSADVYKLNAGSQFDTVTFDHLQSNPWRYRSGGSFYSMASYNYTVGASAPLLTSLGLGSLAGAYHNVLEIDLSSFLDADPGTNVWFSYTMQCGNDSLKGKYGGGFDRVPDAGASVLLIGLGLGALSLFGVRRRA